jgi:hypothetical protein
VLTVDGLERQAHHDDVEARVADLMGSINATTAELVGVIADVIENETWNIAAGIRSPEHWVTWQCGVSQARAESLVRVARRRTELPESSALFDDGRITEDTMAAIARRAPAARDAEIADQVHRMLYSQVDRMLRTMPRDDPPKPPEEPRPDTVTFGAREGDRWVLHANLSIDQGLIVEKALTVGRSQVFREKHPDATNELFIARDVDWADGLIRAAELALRQSSVVNGREHRPSDRVQVMYHYDVAQVRLNPHLGDVLPDSLRRYLLCDADIRAVIESNGVLSEIASKLRTVDDKMRAFIEERDGGCIVCGQKRWLHIHHLQHWEEGGPTASWNLCALCPVHHRIHHLGLLEIRGSPSSPEGLRVFNHMGRELTAIERGITGSASIRGEPYAHPSGEKIDWRDFHWNTLDDADLN